MWYARYRHRACLPWAILILIELKATTLANALSMALARHARQEPRRFRFRRPSLFFCPSARSNAALILASLCVLPVSILSRRGWNQMVHTAAETTCLQLLLAFVSRQHVSLCRAMSAMSGDVVGAVDIVIDTGVSEKHTRGYVQCSISWLRPLHIPH